MRCSRTPGCRRSGCRPTRSAACRCPSMSSSSISMRGSRLPVAVLALLPLAVPAQPLQDGGLGWLVTESSTRPPREARSRPPPERFAAIRADGNFVPPPEQRGGEALLMAAARAGDVEAVRALLKAGANPNVGDYWRDVPLVEAARKDHLELAQALLDAGAVPGLKGRGYTALGLAAKNGNAALVDLLLRAGASPDRKSDDGDTPAHAAARMGHAAVIERLAVARPDWRLFDREGLTPLSVAAANGQYAAAEALARAGAPLDRGDRTFRTPLWWAFSVGDLDMARLLLKLGAQPGGLPVESLQ
ncbi:MAG: hypothetical protein ABS91_00450 [Thiobacillus sp. SCN 64-35]|nr:ankyrin repeat domain-containing protein [Thiobacillus sp.]ODU14171.1 MAG: hypothetical protein ABS91_00450 [Thiobacillus sp. SCN 64-35]ODU88160.1 MAG: hypothetical protein ABT21_12290 [Thiobacillus sp. SCN 65-179]OJW36408.1 MAG: hypothetical protein BGO61_01645 [Thiobacillus sp. 65-69]